MTNSNTTPPRTLIVGRELFGDDPALSSSVVCDALPELALQLTDELTPDLVVLDAETTTDVPKLVARIRESSPRTAVIVIGDAQPGGHVARAITAGAAGYVAKQHPMLPRFATLIGASPPLRACA
jgi:DNA-binding NarL/FixJ family response regulator